MESLVNCVCNHGIERHGARGCPGDRLGTCQCTLTPARALDAAVEAVKTHGVHPAQERARAAARLKQP